MTDLDNKRVALIASLAQINPGKGRTALMKLCYFLQTLRRAPLEYHFTLYSYGPFDSDVLADLDTAEALGAVQASVSYYPGGYGYEIRPAGQCESAKQLAAGFLNRHETDIDWVIAEFGGLDAADLELTSTIVYIDREALSAQERLQNEALVQRVRDVKPHFTEEQVRDQVRDLNEKNILTLT